MAKRHRCHGLSIKELRTMNKHTANLKILRSRRNAIYDLIDKFGSSEFDG